MRPEARAKIDYLGNTEELDLDAMDVSAADMILITRVLKGSYVTELHLEHNDIGIVGCKHLSRVLPDTRIRELCLFKTAIGDEGAQYLGQCLKDSQITELDLGCNDIGDEGGACLAQGLRGSQIRTLTLRHNSIGDEGLKAFAEVLKDTQIEILNFLKNEISCDGARCFNKIMCGTKLQKYFMDVVTSGGRIKQRMKTSDGVRKFEVDLRIRELGLDEVEYLKQFFSLIPEIHNLKIYPQFITEKNAQYLAEAIKDLKIYCLSLDTDIFEKNLVEIPDGIKYLTQAFTNSQIPKVEMYIELKSSEAQYLAEFLKEISVTKLYVGSTAVKEPFLSELGLSLKTSTLLKLVIGKGEISPTGMKSLVQILRHNPITHLDLSYCAIGDAGAKCLAGVLKYSQLTHIDLFKNNMTEVGYRHLAEVIDDSNVCYVRLDLESQSIKRNEITTDAYRIRHAFKTLVGFNSCVQEFQFVLPKKMHDLIVDDYAHFVKELTYNPLVKAHIFNAVCTSNLHSFDYDMMVNINKFTEKVCEKFNEFFNENISAFSFCVAVEIVKKFENNQLSDVVQNLLLHRELFFVDSNKEILHPFIYRLLHKYKMPLYNEQLEPNKKEAIIAFYVKHLDEDVRELIQLLM